MKACKDAISKNIICSLIPPKFNNESKEQSQQKSKSISGYVKNYIVSALKDALLEQITIT